MIFILQKVNYRKGLDVTHLFCRNTNEIYFYKNKNLLYKLKILNFVEWKFKYTSPRSCRHVKDKFWFFLDSEKSTV